MRLPPPTRVVIHAPHLDKPVESMPPLSAVAMRTASLLPVLGLGDLAYRFADPLARLIDRLTQRLPSRLRTRLAGCSACSARRRRWNTLAPDLLALFRRREKATS